MEKKGKIGRREFLGKAALAALAIPVLSGGGLKTALAEKLSKKPARETKTMRRICVEEHWGNMELGEIGMQSYRRAGYEAPVDTSTIPSAFPRLVDFERIRLPLMDQLGIDMQVISVGSPGVQGVVEASKAVDLAKRTNDFQAEVIRKHPTRFSGFAALPTQDPKAAADELERAITQLQFRGAMVQGRANYEYLDQDKHRVLWERAASLGVPIYFHVGEPSMHTVKEYDGHPELLGPTWVWGVEAATHALRIIGSGVFDAYPKAMLILGHLGESLPYLLGRLDEGNAMTYKARKLKKPISEYIRDNIIITTSGLYKPEALVCAINALGPGRILFAVDYPFVEPKVSIDLFERTPMSNADREKIYHLNAERLLKI